MITDVPKDADIRLRFIEAQRLARDGYGWEDIDQALALGEPMARMSVFGNEHFRARYSAAPRAMRAAQ